MMKLIAEKIYFLKGYNHPLKFKGMVWGDYICDICGKNHYIRKLPLLYWFEVNKDNWIKIGTSCIKKVL